MEISPADSAPITRPAAGALRIDTVVVDEGRLVRLHLRGDLDGLNADRLTAAVGEALAAAAPGLLELHVGDVSFVDSSGIRCLLTCRMAADDARTRLVLCDPTPMLVRVLEVVGLLNQFGIAAPVARDTASGPRGPVDAEPRENLQDWTARLLRETRETRTRTRNVIERSASLRTGRS